MLNQSCNNVENNENVISDDEDLVEIVSEIANIIIPNTKTPGARGAKVGSFILMMIADCYPENIQKRFSEGVLNMNALSKVKYGKKFLNLSADKKKIIVDDVVKEERRLKNIERIIYQKLFHLAFLSYFSTSLF